MLARDDDYASAGKPVCDYEDPRAREVLIDALAKDARAILGALDGRDPASAVEQAAAVLAAVVGQDLDADADGVFRIATRVAKDRMISTVDPDARHGRKTSSRGFDGYKGHVAVDPDSELITAATVTAGNAGEGQAVAALLAEELADAEDPAARTSRSRDPVSPSTGAALGLWRFRIRHRERARRAREGRREHPLQGQGASRAGRTVHQGRVPDRPGDRHRRLPRRADRLAASGQGRAGRPLRTGLPGLPAVCAVHHLAQTGRIDPPRPATSSNSPRPRTPNRSGVEGRLHSDPPEGRAEDRSSDATPTRRHAAPVSAAAQR